MVGSLLGGWSPAGHRTWMQTAADGRWEQARGLFTPAPAGDVRALVRGWGEGDVAVEYEWLGHPLVFVGARRGAAERAEFEETAVQVAGSSPSDPALALELLAGAAPGQPVHVELGAANAWRSVGPLRVWTRGEPPFAGDVGALLEERPDLRECVAPVALEVAFDGPRASWIGREVSQPAGNRHVVDAALVESLLGGMFEPAG